MTDDIDEFDHEMLERSNYYEYELPKHDRRSIDEIRRKIKENEYKDQYQVEAHQDFLEHLANNLNRIIKNEKTIGKINWELERQIKEIKDVYLELELLRNRMAKI